MDDHVTSKYIMPKDSGWNTVMEFIFIFKDLLW